VPHLGGLPSIGVNCAACHVGQIDFGATARPVRVLGMTAHFDAEAFLGAMVVATFRTSDPANMKRYLENYLTSSAQDGADPKSQVDAAWDQQEDKIMAAMAADPSGAKDVAPGGLNAIAPADVHINPNVPVGKMDLAAFAHSQLKLLHNIRAALHVPDQPPPASPPNGFGRNDPWRILSYTLLGVVTKPAQVKFGIVWNEDQRSWVHVDANTRSPIIRNLAASLGLGAPMIGHTGVLNFADVERQTALSQIIRPPLYPRSIDRDVARNGAKIYEKNCASCHNGPLTDHRLHAIAEIKTDPNRAEIFTPDIAEQFNRFFAQLQIPGYHPPEKPIRSTQKYWAPSLAGVWARSPYLHNGSVRTMLELLTPPADRAKTFHRGTRTYDPVEMGFIDEGSYVLDTATPGNANTGHTYGTDLSDKERSELIEYLKTL
jgi:Cytochrome c